MKITIKRIGSRISTGNISITENTYMVIEDGREFLLTRTSHVLDSSTGIAGKKGILYVDSDDNKVHHQVVTPSGACGLNTDDEIVEGLSPLALRLVHAADECSEPCEITATTQ